MSSNDQKRQPLTGLSALGFVTDVFISIALPTTLFAWIGRTLDKRWSTSPWMTVVGFILALALSGTLVYRKAKRAAEDMKTGNDIKKT